MRRHGIWYGSGPATRELTELFHPRRHEWRKHFRWDGVMIVGISAIGRTTVDVLQLNAEEQMQLRTVGKD